MKAAVVFVFVLFVGVLLVTPLAAAQPISPALLSPDCPRPQGPSSTTVSPQCGGGSCTPVLVTVTAHVYEGKGQVDLDGVYLSNGQSSQYAAGCGETFVVSAQTLATHYSFLQWVVQFGSVSSPTASPAWYTPPNPSVHTADTISLVLGIDTVSASSVDWNYYNSYLGTGWYAAGYQVGSPWLDGSGNFWAKGSFTLPTLANIAYEYGPCQDISGGKCYNEVLFGVALGYPPLDWSFGGIDMTIDFFTKKVTLNVIWHSPAQESHQAFLGQLGDTISVSVAYQSSTMTDYFYVCDGLFCQDISLIGTPDISRVFYMATMNIYAPNGDINLPPAMWIQAPQITQPIVYSTLAQTVLNPSDLVVCDFNQWGYVITTITPGSTSTASGVSTFALTFSYG